MIFCCYSYRFISSLQFLYILLWIFSNFMELHRGFSTSPILTAGGVNTKTGNEAKYVWYLHGMLISFAFIVSIIVMNLLISIMSDTYANVKKHAEMDWLRRIVNDVLEIDSSSSTAYFKGLLGRLGPKWVPLSEVWMDEHGRKRRKDQLHEARDADINNIKAQVSETKAQVAETKAQVSDMTKRVSDMTKQVSDINKQILSLQQDIGRLTSILLANNSEPTAADGGNNTTRT
ncbi:hypothetical protein Vretimale_18086 [Volvox reticuliferus]|nr:hypothetical protein Vretimale_18086 [Volvox reticuliferus]